MHLKIVCREADDGREDRERACTVSEHRGVGENQETCVIPWESSWGKDGGRERR